MSGDVESVLSSQIGYFRICPARVLLLITGLQQATPLTMTPVIVAALAQSSQERCHSISLRIPHFSQYL
jgi:hypothetical protein